ncbi:conserved hypothetical protein [Desulfarculales bacterium]
MAKNEGTKVSDVPGYVREPESVEPMMEVKETFETLPVKLTDMDYKDFGIKMGQANQDISKAEDELAAVKSQYKSRIDAAVAKRNEYSAIINSGCEYKKVDCHLVKDFQAGTITLIRLDTGEVVRTRTMGMEERQRGLKLEGEATGP